LLAETGLLDNCYATSHWAYQDLFRKYCITRKCISIPRPIYATRTLKRRFKAAIGSSLIEYLQNLRVEEAKCLLESTTLRLEKISQSSGYSDISFFRRMFKLILTDNAKGL